MSYLPKLHTLHKLSIALVAVFVLSLVASAPVLAQVANLEEIQRAAVGLTAIPPRLGDDGTLTAKPGETIQTEVRVRNSSEKPIRVGSLVEDFIIGEDGRTPVPVVATTDSRWSLAKWIELADVERIVPAGGSQTIPVVIHVPENALPGGRYAMIMHEPRVSAASDTQTGQTAGQTGVTQRVGTLVYLRVEGDVKEEAFLRNIKIPSFMEFGPVPITFSVENLSDIHIAPVTSIVIKDAFGLEKGKITVPSQNIFPYTMREFTANWDRVWGFGRYSAEIIVEYGEKHQVVTETAYFWLIPVKLLLALITLILAMIGVGVAIRRHLRHISSEETKHIELLEDRIRQLEDEIGNRHE